jgi:ERCC4-type nuclease
MREPFDLADGCLVFKDKMVNKVGNLTFAAGDTVGKYGKETDLQIALAPPGPGSDVLWVCRDQVHGMERKSWNDLVSSRKCGRLATQLRHMLQHFDVVWLCIEARIIERVKWEQPHWRNDQPGALTDDLMKVLADWQGMGVRLVFTSDPNHTAQFARSLMHKFATTKGGEIGRRMIIPPADASRSILEGIHKVGRVTAARVIENHGGLSQALGDYLTWEPKRLIQKDGAAAKRILAAVGREK